MGDLSVRSTASLLSLLAGLGWFGNAKPSFAELRLCNDTDELQSVALGYRGETDWSSRGWWNIEPGGCATVIEGKLTQRYYYYYADSPSGGFRGQRFVFCVSETAFEITGDTDCPDRGYQEEDFREIDTGETETAFTLALRDAGSAGGVATAEAPRGGEESSGGLGTQVVSETPAATDVTIDTASLISELTAGEFGQAFRTDALFQGCELEDGRAYCGFHAEGVKLKVYFGGPTPETLMYALEAMALNMPVALEGDAVEDRGTERAVVVRAVRPQPSADRYAQTRAALQGDWVSEADRMSEITIRGSEIYVRYEGEFQSSRFLRLADRCEGAPSDGPVMLQTPQGKTDARCYHIAEAGTRLRLSPSNGGGELRFRRP